MQFEIDDLRQDEFLLCLRNEAETFNDSARVKHLLREAATRLERETSRGDVVERQAERFASELLEARKLLENLQSNLLAARTIALHGVETNLGLLDDGYNRIAQALGKREYAGGIPF